MVAIHQSTSAQARLGPNAAAISAQLRARAEDVCQHYLPDGRRVGRDWRVGDISGAAGDSLRVCVRGPNAGLWLDENPAHQDDRGDLLTLIQRMRGHASVRDAMGEAQAFLSGSDAVVQREAPRRDIRLPSQALQDQALQDQARKARALWAQAEPIHTRGSAHYLRARSLSAPAEDVLRHHRQAYYRHPVTGQLTVGPAMLAAVTDRAGTITAVQRTWVRNGAVIARKLMGQPGEGVVRFSRGDTVLVGEGVETVLSLRAVLPRAALHATLGARRLGAYQPQGGTRVLIILGERDAANRTAAEQLTARAMGMGIAVFTLMPMTHKPKGDFNDDLRERGLEALRAHVARQLPL